MLARRERWRQMPVGKATGTMATRERRTATNTAVVVVTITTMRNLTVAVMSMTMRTAAVVIRIITMRVVKAGAPSCMRHWTTLLWR